jgi:hypothetical protein
MTDGKTGMVVGGVGQGRTSESGREIGSAGGVLDKNDGCKMYDGAGATMVLDSGWLIVGC